MSSPNPSRSMVLAGIRSALAAAACVCAFAATAQTGTVGPAPEAGPVPVHFVPPGGPLGDSVPPFLHGIELTEAQRDKIFTLNYTQAPVLREQFKTLEKARRDLRDLVFQGPYDDAKAHALAEIVGHTEAALAYARANTEAQILQLLTPAQRKQFDDAQAKRHGPEGAREGCPDRGPGDRHGPMPPQS